MTNYNRDSIIIRCCKILGIDESVKIGTQVRISAFPAFSPEVQSLLPEITSRTLKTSMN